ncbi:uncharacterized protein CTRU02_206206 [Colletotrichum truncatum]|uniref:Uncharacterized protein n=1 Tax=Colletotrichum truncatum TaxID=5467 RepID=A0ACC3Z663_COLTU|nr:uncharacterized protein CTRU02_10377 [Colletotrichum truncatum]KAF6787114.1 hypothetical protein CTRU02_10377 [Colletotrichum truncatum]
MAIPSPHSFFGLSLQPLQPPLSAEQVHIPAPVALISQPAKRLYWTLQGPLTSSIFIMPEDYSPEAPREPYFQQTLTDTTWHPISQEAMTEQPVASLTVGEEHLSDWQDTWWTLNQEGFDEDVQPAPDDEPPTFEPAGGHGVGGFRHGARFCDGGAPVADDAAGTDFSEG